MSDPHDREPVSQEVIDCWRKNYGLDKRTPAEAARWWHDNLDRKAPAAVVAALGIALDDMDMLREEIERLRAELARCGKDNCMGRRCDDVTNWVTEPAAEARVAAERERIGDWLLKMHERDGHRHNYWMCAWSELYGA